MSEEARQEIRTPEEVLGILAETPLAFLVDALRYGVPEDFDFEDIPIVDGEVTIGYAQEIDRAFHMAVLITERASNRIAEENNAVVRKTHGEARNNPDFCHDVELNRVHTKALHQLAEALNMWMWYSLKRRIGRPATENSVIGIRSGSTVVTLLPEAEAIILQELRDRFLGVKIVVAG